MDLTCQPSLAKPADRPDSQPPFVRRLRGPAGARCAPVKPGLPTPRMALRCAPRRLDPWRDCAPGWRGTRAPQDGGGTTTHPGTDSPHATLPQVPVGLHTASELRPIVGHATSTIGRRWLPGCCDTGVPVSVERLRQAPRRAAGELCVSSVLQVVEWHSAGYCRGCIPSSRKRSVSASRVIEVMLAESM